MAHILSLIVFYGVVIGIAWLLIRISSKSLN